MRRHANVYILYVDSYLYVTLVWQVGKQSDDNEIDTHNYERWHVK